MSYPPYSVLMSLYKKESPSHFDLALKSMLNQTIPPDEVVIVLDGPVPLALENTIDLHIRKNPHLFLVVRLEENQGLGEALRQGVLACKNEIIARMDTDDYAYPNRMELQLGEFSRNPQLGMVGSQVEEFIDDPHNPICSTSLPERHEDILKFSKRRNPFRHPVITFRKSSVLDAGNYRGGFLYFEDWDLFNRMLDQGCLTKNLSNTLLSARTSPDYYERRGGKDYLPHICKFKLDQYRNGYFSASDLLLSLLPHIFVGLMPNKARAFVYAHFLRRKK